MTMMNNYMEKSILELSKCNIKLLYTIEILFITKTASNKPKIILKIILRLVIYVCELQD